MNKATILKKAKQEIVQEQEKKAIRRLKEYFRELAEARKIIRRIERKINTYLEVNFPDEKAKK